MSNDNDDNIKDDGDGCRPGEVQLVVERLLAVVGALREVQQALVLRAAVQLDALLELLVVLLDGVLLRQQQAVALLGLTRELPHLGAPVLDGGLDKTKHKHTQGVTRRLKPVQWTRQ